ncbi:MAG: hypothetical protein R3324_21325, partial [Halobacteriales archaeon]|nr:hypothetical protein [Halobacteriales archaeon]
VLVFLINAWRSYRYGEEAGPDPWDGRTLEWATSSPPPVHNFDEIPLVQHEDDFWYRKYATDEEGHAVPVVAGSSEDGPDDDGNSEDIHLPSPSYYPALAGLGMLIALFGLVYVPWGLVAVGVGGMVMLAGFFGWSMEPLVKEDH